MTNGYTSFGASLAAAIGGGRPVASQSIGGGGLTVSLSRKNDEYSWKTGLDVKKEAPSPKIA